MRRGRQAARAEAPGRGEKGYLFYSVGANGKDDEGRWPDDPRVRGPRPALKKNN